MKKFLSVSNVTSCNVFCLKSQVVVFLLGALLTLAYHPFDIIISIPISFSLFLYYLQKNITKVHKFFTGLIYGLGYFVTSLYWIVNSLFIDIDQYMWMIPIASIVIPLTLSLFIATLAVVLELFNVNKVSYALGFSLLWVIIEWVRGFAILPFPWNFIGYTSLASLYLAQFASVVGVYGMSFLICLFGSSFYTRNIKFIGLIFFFYTAIILYGYLRVSTSTVEYYQNYQVRLVQPNLHIHHMGDPKKQSHAMLKLIEMSLRDTKDYTIIVWPEAAFPYIFSENSTWRMILSEIIPKDGYLIAGTDRAEKIDGDINIYNSIIVLNKMGELKAKYDKVTLVPFGEYIPLRNYLPSFIKKITYGVGDFSSGKVGKVIKLNENLPSIVSLICYESIFTSLIHSYQLEDTGALLNITNDAWFGSSIGPYQHLAMGKMRAIEYGVPLIRAANTGISTVVDPYGREIISLGLNKEGVLDTSIPKRIPSFTFYSQYYYFSFICLFVLLLCLLFVKCRSIRNYDFNSKD